MFTIFLFSQTRLPWWPNIEIIYGKASELRSMFTDTLNKVTTQMSHSHAPLKLTPVSNRLCLCMTLLIFCNAIEFTV